MKAFARSVDVTRRPAQVHAAAPGGLTQTEEPARRGLRLGAGRCGAGAIFEMGHARLQRLLTEKAGKSADTPIELEIGQGMGDVGGMTKCDHAAGERVTHFVNTRADRRLDMIATLGVGETLPTTPGLDHATPFKFVS